MTPEAMALDAAAALQAGTNMTLVRGRGVKMPAKFPRGELLCENFDGTRCYSSGINGKEIYETRMEFIGWVWMQRAHLTRNLNHGWVAFLDSEPMPKRCNECGQLLPPNYRNSAGAEGDPLE